MQHRWSGNSLRKCQLNLIRGDITFELLLYVWLQMSAEHQRASVSKFLPFIPNFLDLISVSLQRALQYYIFIFSIDRVRILV